MNEEQEPSQVEIADYATQPKNPPTGAGTLNPIVKGLRSGLLKMEQVMQVMSPRGYPTDIDSNIYTEPLLIDPLPSMSRMNHGRLFEQRLQAEAAASDSLVYIPADGTPRFIPNRSMGESETRMSLGSPNADFDGNALMAGSDYLMALKKLGADNTERRSAARALVHTATPLDQAEYVNRKLNYLNMDDPEFKAHEADRLRIKEQRRLERIQRKMSSGLTQAEAERADDYNAGVRKEMLGGSPHSTERQVISGERFNDLELMDYEEAVARIMAEGKPGWEARIKNLQAKQAEMQAMLTRSENNDQARRKQQLLDEGYPEAEAEQMKVYNAVEWYNLQLEWHLLREQYHKAQLPRLLKAGHKQVDAIRIAAQIAERYTDGNPNDWPIAPELNWQLADLDVPPPPVLDFSTGDLELPERFIIKDLEGFKFDPEMKFDGLRLPYDSCLFVLGQEPERAVVLATQEDEDVITLKLLSEQKSELPWHADATLYVRLNGTKARLKWANTKRALDKRLGMVSCVLGFLAGEQLNEIEIETVVTAPEGREIPPPKPGWCYNVVHLTQGKKGKRKDWKGGTHASPREHKRKGYWWPGRKGPIWIKATIVNKGVLGRVDKEYHVTKLEAASE